MSVLSFVNTPSFQKSERNHSLIRQGIGRVGIRWDLLGRWWTEFPVSVNSELTSRSPKRVLTFVYSSYISFTKPILSQIIKEWRGGVSPVLPKFSFVSIWIIVVTTSVLPRKCDLDHRDGWVFTSNRSPFILVGCMVKKSTDGPTIRRRGWSTVVSCVISSLYFPT